MKPMEDREFISQMAQFSSLEQMSNVNKEMQYMNKNAKASEAYSLIGKSVIGMNPENGKSVEGVVSHVVKRQNSVKVVVNKVELDVDDIHNISIPNPEAEKSQNKVADKPSGKTIEEPKIVDTNVANPLEAKKSEEHGNIVQAIKSTSAEMTTAVSGETTKNENENIINLNRNRRTYDNSNGSSNRQENNLRYYGTGR